MKKVCIAHRYPIIRVGLRSIFSDQYRCLESDEVGSFQELKKQLAKVSYDGLVLDLFMPGGRGLEVLREIKDSYPSLFVLVLSFCPEDQFGLRAFKAGASGYATKNSSIEQLKEAMKTVLSGKRLFSPITEDKLFRELNNKSIGVPHEQLSDREFHILLGIGEGKSLTQISKDLSLSIKTVSTYRLRALKKMNMKTNAQIMNYVMQVGLILPTTLY